MSGEPPKYMPFWWVRPPVPLVCSGRCLVFEVKAAVMIPGAMTWNDVLDIPEYADVMRMFAFLIETCATLCYPFGIEVLAPSDFDGTLKRTMRPAGYRLWIALKADMWDSFVDQMMVHLTPDAGTTMHLQRDRHAYKRVRTESTNNGKHHRRITTEPEFRRIMRLYHHGTGIVRDLMAVRDLLETLSVTRHFVGVRAEDVYAPQRSPESYIQHEPTQMLLKTSLGGCGLFRVMYTGVGEFIQTSGFELFRYMLPHFEPTHGELVAKIARLRAMSGDSVDKLKHLTIKELLRYESVLGDDAYMDPHEFSPVTMTDLGERITGTMMERITDRMYRVSASMRQIVSTSLDAVKTSKDPIQHLAGVYSKLADDISIFTSLMDLEGVPRIYTNLAHESRRLMDLIREGATNKDASVRQARRLWDLGPLVEGATPMSSALEKLGHFSRECLVLMSTQQTPFLTIWLRTFATTRIDTDGCPNFLLSGKTGTGKSKIWEEVANCLPECMVVVVDTASRLHNTGLGTRDDLRIKIMDEYKFVVPQGDDLRSGSDIKNEQTRISSGLISHERLEQDPVTGEYRSVYHLSLCRWFTISSTNNPETVPDPIANRTCFMPVCEMTKRCQENSISQSAAIAAHEDPDFDRRRRSVHIFLKTIASLQWAYTCPESCGAFPAIDMRCCDLFWQIFESMQGLNQMPPRRTNDIKMLAVSVMIWNCLRTWYIDGLGKEFAFDRPTEIAFYARYRYLRMEDLVMAYTLLEQARSHETETATVMRSLKTMIQVVDGALQSDDTGDAWVLRARSWKHLERSVGTACPTMGQGLCSQILSTLQRTTTYGRPNLAYEPVAHLGGDFFTVNKAWIASVTTPVESAILRGLLQLVETNSPHVHLDYETESNYVFSSQIRAALSSLGGADIVRIPGLDDIMPSAIKHAMCTLEQRCLPETQSRYVERIDTEIDVAIVCREPGPGTVPSEKTPGMYKKRRTEMRGIVVHADTFAVFNDTRVETANLAFIRTALAVAGGYGGSKVFTGIPSDPAEPMGDTYITVPSDGIEPVLVSNKLHYKAPDSILRMVEEDDADDDALFPTDKSAFYVDETTEFETRLARTAQARVPVPKATAERFAYYMTGRRPRGPDSVSPATP